MLLKRDAGYRVESAGSSAVPVILFVELALRLLLFKQFRGQAAAAPAKLHSLSVGRPLLAGIGFGSVPADFRRLCQQQRDLYGPQMSPTSSVQKSAALDVRPLFRSLRQACCRRSCYLMTSNHRRLGRQDSRAGCGSLTVPKPSLMLSNLSDASA